MKHTIQSLVTELERLKATSRDVVVSSSILRASAAENEKGIVLNVPKNGYSNGNGLNPRTDLIRLPLTMYAHEQLATKMKIPLRYYRRILDAGHGQLLADNVNAWIRNREKRLIRIQDARIRAVLSNKYRIMDNYDLLFLALEKFKENRAEIQRCDLSDTRMYVKAYIPALKFDMSNNTIEDPCYPGLILRNSEVGNGRFAVEPLIYRKVCSNGLIAPQTFARVHLGQKLDLGEIFSDETRRLEDAAIWAKVKDIIDATFNPDIIQGWINLLRGTQEIEIPSATLAVGNVVESYGIPEGMKKSILDHFIQEKGTTAYDLVNSITRAAQEAEDYEKQIEMERVGGQLVALKRDDWQKLLVRDLEG